MRNIDKNRNAPVNFSNFYNSASVRIQQRTSSANIEWTRKRGRTKITWQRKTYVEERGKFSTSSLSIVRVCHPVHSVDPAIHTSAAWCSPGRLHRCYLPPKGDKMNFHAEATIYCGSCSSGPKQDENEADEGRGYDEKRLIFVFLFCGRRHRHRHRCWRFEFLLFVISLLDSQSATTAATAAGRRQLFPTTMIERSWHGMYTAMVSRRNLHRVERPLQRSKIKS